MRDRRIPRAGSIVFAAAALAALSGCEPKILGYSIRAPYDMSVRTVYVPVFKSQTFRRDLNFQLTDLVIKEIEKRTPYKVVGSPEGADTILEGTVNLATKNITVENLYNLPRELTAMVNVTVNWTHNPPTEEETKRGPVVVSDMVYFVPEIGDTAMTAFYAACQRLATQVVDMMEQPWQGGEGNGALLPDPDAESLPLSGMGPGPGMLPGPGPVPPGVVPALPR
jgi:hypothetical protein